jgi:hypothetical protein
MTMAEGMVRPDALSQRDGRLALAVRTRRRAKTA